MLKKKVSIMVVSFLMLMSTFGLVPKEAFAATSFIWPTEGDLTQGFGGGHYGIDIANGTSVPIKASASGTVSKSYYSSSYGEVVFIKHNINGVTYETVYAHMISGSRKVSVGQSVSQGTVLGSMGNTGDSKGQHLHFELHKGLWNESKSNAVNPLEYIGKDQTVTYHEYDGTFATLKINVAGGGNVNVFASPGAGLKGTLPNGGTYKVYGKAIGADKNTYYDVGNNTWILSVHVIVTPYIAKVDYSTNVNVYNGPNGTYVDRVSPGSTYKLYGAKDGWYDIGDKKWIKAEYVKVTK